MADNDLQKAEEWLYKQAEKEGWTKAQKLKGRSTSQGLVGVLVQNNFVSLVEVFIYNNLYTEKYFYFQFDWYDLFIGYPLTYNMRYMYYLNSL